MALATPVLDDRKFQDLVDEAKKRIPHFTKEWTDHNVSDPGVTMIELFAWMTEVMLYRMNQVPDLHYIRFLEMMGITLDEPIPARVPETFWLSAPQETSVLIPAGTEVASTQTETETSIIFTTDVDFRVDLPILKMVMSRNTGSDGKKHYSSQNLRRLEAGFEGFEVFTTVPQVDDALYFGFENDLSHHILGFEMDWDSAGGAGIDPTLPPYIWEVSTGEREDRWKTCEIDEDTTKGMNVTGRTHLHLPKMGKYKIGKEDFFWVRARVNEISDADKSLGMRPYQVTPKLRQSSVATWGGSIPSTHAQLVAREFLGRSEGSPGARYRLQQAPMLPRKPDEQLVVQVEGEPTQHWIEVTDFSSSGSEDRHYTLDGVTGELRLGPAVRQPDGTMKLYGSIPPRSANLVFSSYRYGGGQVGNVQAGILNTLKTAIPFIAQVRNREPAWGGLDAETLELAMMRAPAMLRSCDRAVTEFDYEFLARRALPAAIGRVKCLQPRPAEAGRVVPGQVYVLTIPRVRRPDILLEPEQLELADGDVKLLTEYLDERRLLTTQLDIRSPAYYWVSVKVELRADPGMDPAVVEAEVLNRLYRFLNPLTGGKTGKGWPFGRDLFVSDVYQCLQGTANVQFVRNVQMFAAQPAGGPQGDAVELIEVLAHGVVASGIHEVEFV